MADSSRMSGPFRPQGTSQKSLVGPWGGGSRYIQSPTPSREFTKTSPFTGHSQAGNMKELRFKK